jgi:hypothetical protein
MDVVGYVWRPWGIHIDIVRDRGSKGMDRCPLTGMSYCVHCFLAKRNKSDREENDEVKNKNWKEGTAQNASWH